MKRIRFKAVAVFCIILVVCMTFFFAHEYLDRRQCVCSMLTGEEQTFSIDDRLYRVCEKDLLKSGTFRYMQTTCAHGRRMLLTVFPDEGEFKGYIL